MSRLYPNPAESQFADLPLDPLLELRDRYRQLLSELPHESHLCTVHETRYCAQLQATLREIEAVVANRMAPPPAEALADPSPWAELSIPEIIQALFQFEHWILDLDTVIEGDTTATEALEEQAFCRRQLREIRKDLRRREWATKAVAR